MVKILDTVPSVLLAIRQLKRSVSSREVPHEGAAIQSICRTHKSPKKLSTSEVEYAAMIEGVDQGGALPAARAVVCIARF